MFKPYRSSIMTARITVGFLIMFFLSLVWFMLSAPPPWIIYLCLGISAMMLVPAFFINLGFALFCAKSRMAHITVTAFIVFMFCVLFPVSIKVSREKEHKLFFRKGIHDYDLLVDKILANKSTLAAEAKSLEFITGLANVYGKTNSDGSLSIWFHGRDNYPRAGYLYYSGNALRVKPGDINGYFFENNPADHTYYHLTNNWYEF